MENYEKLKENLPDIAKMIAEFPESLQGKVFETLISELLGKKNLIVSTEPVESKSDAIPKIQPSDEVSSIATLTPEGKFHLSIRDLKASNAKDATKRLVYVIIRSYTQLANKSSVSRKKIINPELVNWRLSSGSIREYIANDKGIIKQRDQYSLDLPAQNEADQFIKEIQDSSKVGTWKPESIKRNRVSKAENGKDQREENLPGISANADNTNNSANVEPQSHTLDELKTTSNIAQILNVKTEMDLILAAAMKLSIMDQKDTFTREEILKEMKTATDYYRASYLNNATDKLKRLVKAEKLRLNAPGIYALSMNTKKELRQRIGLQ